MECFFNIVNFQMMITVKVITKFYRSIVNRLKRLKLQLMSSDGKWRICLLDLNKNKTKCSRAERALIYSQLSCSRVNEAKMIRERVWSLSDSIALLVEKAYFPSEISGFQGSRYLPLLLASCSLGRSMLSSSVFNEHLHS